VTENRFSVEAKKGERSMDLVLNLNDEEAKRVEELCERFDLDPVGVVHRLIIQAGDATDAVGDAPQREPRDATSPMAATRDPLGPSKKGASPLATWASMRRR